MTRRLLAGYLTITIFVLAVLAVPLGFTFADRERTLLFADLERDARIVAVEVEEPLEQGEPVDASPRILDYARQAGARVVVVDDAGVSWFDTDAGPDAPRRDFSTRPEFVDALAGGQALGERFSETIGARLFFVAVPVASTDGIFGAVRISLPASEFDERVADNWRRLGLLAVVVLLAVTVVGWITARTLTGPIRELQNGAVGLSNGDLSTRVAADRGPPELREAAATFNAMAGRLEHLVDSQRWFVSAASHELRTPLTALRLRLETLEDAVTGEDRDRLDAALAETDRFAALVDGLLALARADAGAASPVAIDVAAVARARFDLWEPLCAERGIELHVGDADQLVVLALPTALGQVVDNLIANATDAVADGGRIEVVFERGPSMVAVTVADDGPGVPEDQWEAVFERFRRGSDVITEGSGLGLALVRQLAEASGGEATAIDHPLGGFAVRVTFPIAPRGAEPAPG